MTAAFVSAWILDKADRCLLIKGSGEAAASVCCGGGGGNMTRLQRFIIFLFFIIHHREIVAYLIIQSDYRKAASHLIKGNLQKDP